MTQAEKLAALQAAFPALGITLGYLGNIYMGRYARDDRSFYIFTMAIDRDTRLPNNWGERISISCDYRNMTVEQLKRRVMLRFCAANGKFEVAPRSVLKLKGEMVTVETSNDPDAGKLLFNPRS